mmetsp:Transcript_5614/g.9671  ORF Transcript_5614/g.9671 Transcript_5614/m.9671 type:complete len:124 (+) Transcript_5614:1150-1521(+)
MPTLLQRELYARALTLEQCRKLFNETIELWNTEQTLYYDPQLKYKEVFLLPRIRYMTEVLRQLATTHQRIVAVVDTEHVGIFEKEWQELPPKLRSLESLLSIPKDINGMNRMLKGYQGLDMVL